MKNTNRQTSPLGRSTKKKHAGLSLLQSSCLFIVHGNSYIYCTEIVNTISKNTSDFISHLTRKKFKNVDMVCFGYLPWKKTIFSFSVWYRDLSGSLNRKVHQVKF